MTAGRPPAQNRSVDDGGPLALDRETMRSLGYRTVDMLVSAEELRRLVEELPVIETRIRTAVEQHLQKV